MEVERSLWSWMKLEDLPWKKVRKFLKKINLFLLWVIIISSMWSRPVFYNACDRRSYKL
jgi:hypothetical protein